LYLYNTTGAYRFSVESEEAPKESGTGYHRNNTYVYTKDNALTGKYTLTMVYDINLIRYEGQYKVVQRTLNEEGEEASRMEKAYEETFDYKEKRYDFDLYNTESYELNVYGDLYLGDFYDNKDIFAGLVEFYKNKGSDKANLGLYWVDTTSSTTKDYHSFVVYRKNIKHTTLIDVVPTVSGKNMELVVNFDERTGSEIVDPPDYGTVFGVRPGKKYMVYYITLETDKGVKVSISYNVGQTTNEEELESKFNHEFLKDTATQKLNTLDKEIHFDVKGMMSTELVKYMVGLNDTVIELLNGCKTPEELERMLNYLSVLLNTEEELISLYKNYPDRDLTDPVYKAFEKAVKQSVIKEDFKTLFYQLTHITNYGTVEEILGYLPSVIEITDEYRPIFYSPYGIYYLWMQAYGYLPANMQTK
jgi:hypothetical protein